MRSGAKPDTLLERALMTAGLVPTPFLDTFIGLLLVRTVLTATKLGVFEALADCDLTCQALSERIGTEPQATGKLLDALVASDYLTRKSGRHGLAPTARKWMLADSPKPLRDFVLLREYQSDLLKGYEDFVRSGVPLRSRNALEDDLGDASWDVVFMAQVAHHFDEPRNRALASRIATALKPGGVFALLEMERPSNERPTGQSGALMDLYFAFTSESGTWNAKEMAQWQRQAELDVRSPIRLRRSPGTILQVGVKPAAPRQRGGR